jgi:hypothetical protein
MEMRFTIWERNVGGETEYVIRLNDRALRSYKLPPGEDEVNAMRRAVMQVLKEHTNCLHCWLDDSYFVFTPEETE